MVLVFGISHVAGVLGTLKGEMEEGGKGRAEERRRIGEKRREWGGREKRREQRGGRGGRRGSRERRAESGRREGGDETGEQRGGRTEE